MIMTSAPGKLYIAGEYAVIEPGYPAILVAVDQFIRVSLEQASGKGSISSYDGKPVLWTRENDRITLEQDDNRLSYIITAINMAETYAKEQGIELRFFNLKVFSELETNEGIKYGLGSSAAVTVAAIKALCHYYKITISDEQMFKLASLSHLAINSNGSCGDVAASIYGGWIAFRTFDKSWVLEQRKTNSITQLLNKEWPYLSIESLKPPEELKLVIGWTGLPASTTGLVDNVHKKRTQNSTLYKSFLYDSKKCVTKMIAAFKEDKLEEIQRQIQINRKLLAKMRNDLGIVIETPLLEKLCDIALRFDGYGKSSGAGGGDCGIVIFKKDDDLAEVIDEWKREGITHLPLKVYEKKASHS